MDVRLCGELGLDRLDFDERGETPVLPPFLLMTRFPEGVRFIAGGTEGLLPRLTALRLAAGGLSWAVPGFAMVRPEVAIALAKPEGLDVGFDRFHGLFLSLLGVIEGEADAIDIASESRGGNREGDFAVLPLVSGTMGENSGETSAVGDSVIGVIDIWDLSSSSVCLKSGVVAARRWALVGGLVVTIDLSDLFEVW